MGIDIATYRSRIGCCHQNIGLDVVHYTVPINFSTTIKWLCVLPVLLFIFLLFINQNVLFGKGIYDLSVVDLAKSTSAVAGFHLVVARKEETTKLKCHGALTFIGLLLIIAGIETNPGPLPMKDEPSQQEMSNESSTPAEDIQMMPLQASSLRRAQVPQQSDEIHDDSETSDPDKTGARVPQEPYAEKYDNSAKSDTDKTEESVPQEPYEEIYDNSAKSDSDKTGDPVPQEPYDEIYDNSAKSVSDKTGDPVPQEPYDEIYDNSAKSDSSDDEYEDAVSKQGETNTDPTKSNTGKRRGDVPLEPYDEKNDASSKSDTDKTRAHVSLESYGDKYDDLAKSDTGTSIANALGDTLKENQKVADSDAQVVALEENQEHSAKSSTGTTATITDSPVESLEETQNASMVMADNGNMEQQASVIREKLLITDKFPSKITLEAVMEISSIPEEKGYFHFHLTLLRKLLMFNFEARDTCPYELQKQEEGRESDYSDNDSDFGDDDNEILANHDVFVNIFNCCDHMLKKGLVSKMFLCRLAVPLIYPTFQCGKSCFSLWPLRFINLDLEETEHNSLSLATYPHKVVSFVRLSRPKYSKSMLLNAVISNRPSHILPTFYDKDCYLGGYQRKVTNGLVEASWYMPGKQKENNVFQEMIMFTNLRGNAVDYEEKVKTLEDISNCIVVIIDNHDIEKHLVFIKELKMQTKSVIMLVTGENPRKILKNFETDLQGITIIKLYDRTTRNNAELSSDMQKVISERLQQSDVTSIETCASIADEHGIQVDERSEICTVSKQAALHLSRDIGHFQSIDAKERMLPLQDLWNKFSEQAKCIKRSDKSNIPSKRMKHDANSLS